MPNDMTDESFNLFDTIIKISYCKTCSTGKTYYTGSINCAESGHDISDLIILSEAEDIIKQDYIPRKDAIEKSKIDKLIEELNDEHIVNFIEEIENSRLWKHPSIEERLKWMNQWLYESQKGRTLLKQIEILQKLRDGEL